MASPESCAVPAELQLDVIEYLHDDESALRNCSLVCKSWAEHSRIHLWKKTALISRDGAGAVSEKHVVLIDTEEVGYFFRATSMEDATAFFTANPSLAKLVKMFRIDGFAGVTVNALSLLLVALPNLAHLDIVCTDFPSLPEVVSDLEREKLITKPVYTHQLDYVYFHRCNIVDRDIDILLRVLGLFSSIDTLKFEGSGDNIRKVQIEGWSFDSATHLRQDVPHPPQPEVRRLVPEMVHASVLGYLFSNTTLARNLKDLMLLPPNVWTYADLIYMARALLPPVTGTLNRFHFVPGVCMAMVTPQSLEDHQAVDEAFTIIAKACASVEFMSFSLLHNLMLDSQPLDFSYLFDGFVKILERMPPKASLKTLEVHILVDNSNATCIIPQNPASNVEVIKEYNWPALEHVLLAAPRRKVKLRVTVSFVTYVAPTDESRGVFAHSMDWQLEFAKDISKRMPRLYRQGRDRLYVEFGEMRTQFW